MPTVRRQPLLAQVLALNALLVFGTVLVASVVSQLRLDVSVQRREFLVYLLALCASLLANAFLVRRRFAPLERLIDTMERADLDATAPAMPLARADSREEERLIATFNRMLGRLLVGHPSSSLGRVGILPVVQKFLSICSARMEAGDGCDQADRGVGGGSGGA